MEAAGESYASGTVVLQAIKFNVAVEEPLATTTLLLHAQLKAMDYKKGVCLSYLKRQFDARMTRAEADNYTYDELSTRFVWNT